MFSLKFRPKDSVKLVQTVEVLIDLSILFQINRIFNWMKQNHLFSRLLLNGLVFVPMVAAERFSFLDLWLQRYGGWGFKLGFLNRYYIVRFISLYLFGFKLGFFCVLYHLHGLRFGFGFYLLKKWRWVDKKKNGNEL